MANHDETMEKQAYDQKYYEEMRKHLKTKTVNEKLQKLISALIKACFQLKNARVYCYQTDIVVALPLGTDMASPNIQKLKRYIPQLVNVKGIRLHAPDERFNEGPQVIISL